MNNYSCVLKNRYWGNYFLDFIIVGAGQAGLSRGYYLQKESYNFVILDGGKRIGDSWRNRYEPLVLFTHRLHSSLPGMKFLTS
ncbi:NAD(P)-binding protein [Bacillus bingmayongensis]|nr:NAD(P)-binding protein [Bacillus bingmayongensis]